MKASQQPVYWNIPIVMTASIKNTRRWNIRGQRKVWPVRYNTILFIKKCTRSNKRGTFGNTPSSFRGAKKWAELYKQRSAVERVNAYLMWKDVTDLKNVVKGIVFLFSGVLIFCSTYITTAIYAHTLQEWDSRYGKFGTSFRDINGLALFIIAIIFIAIGIFYFNKDKKTTWNIHENLLITL